MAASNKGIPFKEKIQENELVVLKKTEVTCEKNSSN